MFGLKGEIKCDPTSAGRTIFSRGASIRCELGAVSETVTVTGVREHQGRLLIKLQGVEDATAAQRFIGGKFYAPREAFVLEDGEYLDEDLVGCRLLDEAGKELGSVTALEHYPAQDMLVVKNARVPMVAAFIKSIDITAKCITVDLPAGLLDDSKAEEA